MNSFSITINKERENLQRLSFKNAGLDIPIYWLGYQFKNLSGPQNLLLGHLSIIRYAKYKKLPEVIIYEDDAYPCIDCGKKLEAVIRTLPKDTQFLLLGWSRNDIVRQDEFTPIKPTQIICGSHSYLIREQAYDKCLSIVDLNLPSDRLYQKIEHGCYSIKSPIFIQYCSKPSMNGYSRYIYDAGNRKEPPIGFPTIETIQRNVQSN